MRRISSLILGTENLAPPLRPALFPPRTRYLAKDDVVFNPNQTVSFRLPAGAIFEPSMSVGPEEDMVTSLNLVVAVSQCHAICAVIAKMTKSNNDEAVCAAKRPL